MKIYKGITQQSIRSKGYAGLTTYPKSKWNELKTFNRGEKEWGRGNIRIRASKFYVEIVNDWNGKVIGMRSVPNMKESLKIASIWRRQIR